MQNTFGCIALAVLLALPSPAFGQEKPIRLKASVWGDQGGDTAIFDSPAEGGEPKRLIVRFDGVDAPETGQPFADRAKARMQMLLKGECELLITRMGDRSRVVAYVLAGGVNVNQRLIRDGLAWHDLRFNRDVELAEAQLEAIKARRGLWRDPKAVPPWVWRMEGKGSADNPFDAVPPPVVETPQPSDQSSLGFLLKGVRFTKDDEIIGEIFNHNGRDVSVTRFSISIYSPGGRLKDVVNLEFGQFENDTVRAFKQKTDGGLPDGSKYIFHCEERSEF